MPLDILRSKLISSGYTPEEVEYSLLEVLQYKKPESLDNADFKILAGILKKRKSGAQRMVESRKCYNCYFCA
jgi:hypothetical protein